MINEDVFRGQVVCDMLSIINNYLGNYKVSYGIADTDIGEFSEEILNEKLMADIQNLVENDPAVKVVSNSYSYAFKNYKGMRAILYYRIANQLIYNNTLVDEYEDDYNDMLEDNDDDISMRDIFLGLARKISEDAAVATTIEINPKAKIGKGFVIDHGINVKIATDIKDESGIVVGETCEIGENCCLLNGVVLGAIDVNDGSENPKRHPIIGNNVTICSNVKILGRVTIGNNVFISPNCIITENIPSDCKVNMINQLQLTKFIKKNKQDDVTIYGLIPIDDILYLYGDNLSNVNLSVVNEKHKIVDSVELKIISHGEKVISFRLNRDEKNTKIPKSVYLLIKNQNTLIYLYNSRAMQNIIIKLMKNNGGKVNE